MRRNKTNHRSFPWWYFWVKWMLPLSLAILAGAGVGFTLTGAIACYEAFQWAPLLFASLEGSAAISFLALAVTATASIIGIVTSFFIRAGLFHVTESIATQNLECVNRLHDLLEQKETDFAEEREEMQQALATENQQREKITQEYYLLRGRITAPVSGREIRGKRVNVNEIEPDEEIVDDVPSIEESVKRYKKVAKR